MIVTRVAKDPDSILSYGWDWANFGSNDGTSTDPGWLQGDTISTSSWTITGDDALLVNDSDANTSTQATVVLSGGTIGQTYLVTNHIVTAAGYEEDRSMSVYIRER